MRTEAQKRADKRYREAHRNDFLSWSTAFPPEEIQHINEVIKSSGMTKADFIRWAVKKYQEKNN